MLLINKGKKKDSMPFGHEPHENVQSVKVSISPSVSTLDVAAFVESRHGFICRSGLNLHEICPRVSALGTGFRSRVHVLPGRSSTEDIVHLLQLGILPVVHLPRDVVHVGTSVAGEPHALLSLLDDQHVPTGRTEEEHVSPETNM